MFLLRSEKNQVITELFCVNSKLSAISISLNVAFTLDSRDILNEALTSINDIIKDNIVLVDKLSNK